MSSPQTPLVQKVLDAAGTLPPFPDVMWKVMPLIRAMAPVQEIEAVIKYDPVITAKVLSYSRSPHFARKHTIGSLRDAIVLLGQQQLIQVIVAACSARYFQGETPGYDLQQGEAWEHAVATALMTEIIARRLGLEQSLTAYTAALLHDIGKTVLSVFVHDHFERILALVSEKKMRFLDAEREVLGIDHQQLGTMVAERWRLPAEVIIAIGYHHRPKEAPENKDMVSLIYVANRLVSGIGIGTGVDSFLQPNQDEVFVEMGITPRMSEQFLIDLVEAMKEARQFLASS